MKSTRDVSKQVDKQEATVEVLYQKLGDRWFAFSLINDEVFVGSINPDEIDATPKKTPKKKVLGNT